MATPTGPVPWPEVADLAGDLLEWLVKEGNLDAAQARKRPPLHLARELLRSAERGSLVAGVAAWIIVLDRYEAAGSRKTTAAARPELSLTEKDFLYNDEIEREADTKIRGLRHQIAQIRRLVRKIGIRQEKRIELLLHDKNPERRTLLQARNREAFSALNEDFDLFIDAIEGLRASFHQFNQARTPAPLTLSGWQDLRRRIKQSLVAAGYPWPKESSRRRSSSPRVRDRRKG